ncbi:hypothetical protein Q8A73_009491 [Channa argus]|nr:hypothetical protein Q8A73_009491 [Channa argus]
MKQDIMAEGPRCKRRKQANPRRKNGKTARTPHTENATSLRRPSPATRPSRAPRMSRPRGSESDGAEPGPVGWSGSQGRKNRYFRAAAARGTFGSEPGLE